jgi:hypothetical protein
MDPRGTPADAGRNAVWKRIGIIFLAAFGIGAIALIAVGFLVVKKKYPWILELGRASQEMMKRSTTSPATAELNRTLCDQSMVMATEDLTRLQGIMKPKPGEKLPSEFRWMVSCHVRDPSKAPECDRVAKTFRAAVPDHGKFMVFVTAGMFRTAAKPLCMVAYGADGKAIRKAEGSSSDSDDDRASPAPGR